MVTRIEKFGASWCGPCKVLDRTLEQISGIEIVKHDVDDLDTLRDSMELEYKIEVVNGDE